MGAGVKLHVGCGSVLLRDWVNVDLPLPHVFLSKERPDLVERFITTEDDYYGRHDDKTADSLRKGPVTGQTCCDTYGAFSFLPARDGTVSEILSVQVFEHLPRNEAADALKESWRVLKTGGILRIDIPDPDETIRQYRASGDEFLLRHLFGPRRNQFGYHTPYNRQMLIDLARDHGFKFLAEEKFDHFYPSFCCRFEKISIENPS